MLSEKLASMASFIEEHAHTGLTAGPEGVERMVTRLREMEEEAEQLELTTRPIAGLGGTMEIKVPKDGLIVRLAPGPGR